jgi:hypothetical protein
LNPAPPIFLNLNIPSTSAAASAGQFLCNISSSTGSGTSFTVYSNANYFWAPQTAAFRTVPGAAIETSAGQTATITAISGNTITVTPSITWTHNDGVSYPYASVAPSVGAKDFGYAVSISIQPQNSTISSGSTANFSVTASGTSPLTYQWYFNSSAISGATLSSLSIPSATSANAGNYQVDLNNPYGPLDSSVATLTVTGGGSPTITAQPQSVVEFIGQTANFNVSATGGPLTYQWYLNGISLAGATLSTLTLASAPYADVGSYNVVVANSSGNTPSSMAVLSFVTNNVVTGTIAPNGLKLIGAPASATNGTGFIGQPFP